MKQLTCLFPSKVTIKMPQVLSRVGFDCSKPPTSMHSSIDNDRGVLTSSCLHETLNEGGWCFGQSKKRQIKDTMNLVIKKRKEYEEKMKEKGEALVMFSSYIHKGKIVIYLKELYLQDSVYYHPQWNPTGAPPSGKPSMYKSSIRPIVFVVLFWFYFCRCVWCCFNAELVNLSCFEVT
ncbi:hypothetical protein LXL04_019726 [Taraxacum kok-saghyz]